MNTEKTRAELGTKGLLVCKYCGAKGEVNPPIQSDEIRFMRCGNPDCRMVIIINQANAQGQP
jgi:hypothetical protein